MQTASKHILKTTLGFLSALFLIFFATQAIHGLYDFPSAMLATGFAFSHMDWEGGDNIGGFTSEAYLALHHEIDTWPSLAENPESDSDLVTLTGEYAFKPGKSFYKIYVTPRTFGMEAENQGEIDGKSFVQKGEFFFPGTREKSLALARKLNNNRGVLIGIDPNTGKQIQMGSQEFPCHFSPKLNFGSEPTSRRGLTVEFEADGFLPAMIYDGNLTLDAAV